MCKTRFSLFVANKPPASVDLADLNSGSLIVEVIYRVSLINEWALLLESTKELTLTITSGACCSCQ